MRLIASLTAMLLTGPAAAQTEGGGAGMGYRAISEGRICFDGGGAQIDCAGGDTTLNRILKDHVDHLKRPRPWTMLVVYRSGRVVQNDGFLTEAKCQEALCWLKHSMSCAEKKLDDEKRAERARQDTLKERELDLEWERKKAEYRLTHPCKISKEKFLSAGDKAIPDQVEVTRCPLPDDGGEEIFVDGGRVLISGGRPSGTGTLRIDWSYSSANDTEIVKTVCYRETDK